MTRVLVTGGKGFIGSHIVETLRKAGYDAGALDIICSTKGVEALSCFKDIKELGRYFDCDIRKFDEVERVFKLFQPEYVIHCAAKARIQPSLQNPVETYETNVLGTLNLLEVSRRFGVKKFVYSASSSAYGANVKMPLKESMKPRPLNPYAYSKLMAEMLIEQYVKNFGLKACLLRYFNVYGPGQPTEGQYATVIGIFLRQFANSEPFTIVPDGRQRRDFTWVGDVVRANLLAMESEKVGKAEVINIGFGKNYSILEVADILGGKDYPRKMIESRAGEARATLADISKAKKLLGWEPEISLEEGIELLKNQIR
ncbi:MAG: NAD-dependent epimerase/dehydratase family protein [bacterium]|nr:NAD-dependent epimerase/dehydratase family protein [bacterium]